MNTTRDETRKQLERLADTLERDVDQLTDEEVLREAAEEYGDSEKAVLEIRHLVQESISAYGQRRLAAAREAYQAESAKSELKVFELSTERKQKIVEQFADNDNQFREKLTLAARNQEDFEADLDSFLEDLIELGAIDDEGNVR